MEARISLVTLGVDDLERSVAFYRDGLGFPTSYESGGPPVAFFDLGGAKLGLYGRASLAEDIDPVLPAERGGFSAVTIGHNVRTREEVAEVLALAERAGGRIVKPAQDVFWGGHSGYFADPDGHYWEVAYNPFFPIAEDGSISLSAPE